MQNLTGGSHTDTFNYTGSTSLVTGAINESGGALTLNDSGSLTVQNSVFTHGGSLTVTANAISVTPQSSNPLTISTRQVAANADPVTGVSTGYSGAISFTAPNIIVGSSVNATLTATANGAFQSGAIDLEATDDVGSLSSAGPVYINGGRPPSL